MRNPEDELPPIMVECPTCEGSCYSSSLQGMDEEGNYGYYPPCETCDGAGEVEQDATDARDDALEARSHVRREEREE